MDKPSDEKIQHILISKLSAKLGNSDHLLVSYLQNLFQFTDKYQTSNFSKNFDAYQPSQSLDIPNVVIYVMSSVSSVASILGESFYSETLQTFSSYLTQPAKCIHYLNKILKVKLFIIVSLRSNHDTPSNDANLSDIHFTGLSMLTKTFANSMRKQSTRIVYVKVEGNFDIDKLCGFIASLTESSAEYLNGTTIVVNSKYGK